MVSRRRFIALAALPALPVNAQVTPNPHFDVDVSALLNTLTGGKPVATARVQMDLPILVENGQSVTLRMGVPDAKTGEVKSLHIIAPRNPRPMVASFHFGKESAKPDVVTRIRLGGTQTVRVLAAFADGTFAMAATQVEVTSSACLDAASL